MNTRKTLISLILKNSELFTEEELIKYSNKELLATMRTLFINIRIKQLQSKQQPGK